MPHSSRTHWRLDVSHFSEGISGGHDAGFIAGVDVPTQYHPHPRHAEMAQMTAGWTPENAYTQCREIAREAAKTFYYGSLFLPREKRLATWAIYAFCRIADDIADEPDVYGDRHEALAAWNEALRATYSGHPQGAVMTAWAHMLNRFDVPIEPALELLQGVAMDLDGTCIETFDDLRLYCYRVAGTVGLLMAPILGYTHPAALEAAVDLGIAMQLTNILRDIGEDAAAGRIYLPAEDLRRFICTREALRGGTVTESFIKLMEFQIARAEEYYQRGLRGIVYLQADARLAIALSASLYRKILHRIRRNEYDVFRRRAHVPLRGKLAAIPGTWLDMRRNLRLAKQF